MTALLVLGTAFACSLRLCWLLVTYGEDRGRH
jgi:hypothetical protein